LYLFLTESSLYLTTIVFFVPIGIKTLLFQGHVFLLRFNIAVSRAVQRALAAWVSLSRCASARSGPL